MRPEEQALSVLCTKWGFLLFLKAICHGWGRAGAQGSWASPARGAVMAADPAWVSPQVLLVDILD